MANVQNPLRDLTPESFAHLGEGDVVYIKPIERHGMENFAIFGASGRVLAVFDSWEDALLTARENNMAAAYLH